MGVQIRIARRAGLPLKNQSILSVGTNRTPTVEVPPQAFICNKQIKIGLPLDVHFGDVALFLLAGGFNRRNINFAHVHHGFKGSFGGCAVGISDGIDQFPRGNLP